jgi:hypothetical protein
MVCKVKSWLSQMKIEPLTVMPPSYSTPVRSAWTLRLRSGQAREGARPHTTLFFCGAVMLLPVGSIASTVERDLGENELGGKAAFGEVGGDSLLRLLR